jgi:hypothetical protein
LAIGVRRAVCQFSALGRAVGQAVPCVLATEAAVSGRRNFSRLRSQTAAVFGFARSRREEDVAMKTRVCVTMLVVALLPARARCETPALSPEKAEMMGRVEDFFLHNFRDVTWRKSLEWGDVNTEGDGSRTIQYTYEALIWGKDHQIMCQVFTFDPDGKWLRYENVAGFPKEKVQQKVNVSTQNGMIDLVEDFFSKNFRDVTARKTLEWGKPIKDADGNTSIAYKYEATIGDKDKKVMNQVFTFDPSGKFVSVKEAQAEPEQSGQSP